MNYNWHIQRASLASSAPSASSSNHSHNSHSNPPTMTKRASPANNYIANYGVGEQVGGKQSARVHGQRSASRTARRDSELYADRAAAKAAAATAVLAAAAAAKKRGSRSSQGSTDSNNSTRSAASGSLLLTAANLERFAEIHKKQQTHNKLYLEAGGMPGVMHQNATTALAATIYNANLVHALQAAPQLHMGMGMGISQHGNGGNGASQHNHNSNKNNDTIITLDPNLHFIKTKDLDSVSVASSMHFTMVNGEDGPPKAPKRGLCDRGRQVTVLIISMSAVFLLLIMGMVYALEMRAREMPQS